MQKYNSRSEVPEEFKWDLTDFFKDEKDFEESYLKTTKLVDELKQFSGCTKNPNKLHEYLEKQINAEALVMDLYAYACLINDQELGIAESIIRKNKTEQLYNSLVTNTSFFAPELLELSENEYKQLSVNHKPLEEFEEYLDKVYREKAHTLTENEEKIVAELTRVANNYDDISSNLLNKEHNYGKIKLEDGTIIDIATNNYRNLMRNKDVNIRKKVYNLFNKTIDQYSSTNAFLLNSYVTTNDSLAKIRHYKDSWYEKLYGLNLSDKVFKSLVRATEENLSSLHKYYKLKSDVLGFDYLHSYDMNLDLKKSKVKYSIPEAQQLVRNSIMPLGEKYLEKYDKIIKNRYIDYCQYKGKYAGGYSMATILKDSRIMMSFNENLDSVSTIAHEAGHNVHHQFVNENNSLQYRHTPNITTEVVSLTNECLLSNYLVENGKTKDEKLSGLANLLGVIASNLFGAVREGKIEEDMYQEVHKGGTITKEFMDKITKKSMKKYCGKYVKLDKYSKNSWVTRRHYYMHFYLYSYAICISVALNVASKILEGDKEMLNNYYEFMKCGSDKWPSEIFSVLGIDLEDEKVYENAIKYFDSLIDKYYEIYNQEVGE